MRDAALPVTLIVVGLAWLAWQLGWFPDVDWIIAVGFIVGGIAVLVIDGITKSSIVLGPFLAGVGIAWWLHDVERVRWAVLIPTLLVLLGALMLVSRHRAIPERRGERPRELPPPPAPPPA
jgi:hypothetical protein